MSWTLLLALVCVLGLSLFAALTRRAELARMRKSTRERERAVRLGAAEAQLRHPLVDLSRCLGCGTCVEACPEDGVLALVHGQAVVVNGARCVGIAKCERECPVGAITVTLGDVSKRTDVPALDPRLEAVGTRGLFLAGEVTAHALIKTAIEQGAAVGAEVARRVRESHATAGDGALDLCIVGAGPAGIACALEAQRHGLRYVVLEQERDVGGTVARYPRRKLVVTEPVELPLFGQLGQDAYTKEELVELWQRLVEEHRLPVRTGEVVVDVDRAEDGGFELETNEATYRARHVCMALGRRGVPRKLDVPGEDLAKVAYGLLDARAHHGRRALVVGGGDSAVETALGLAEQPGNDVTLVYRRAGFFRLRARNEKRVEKAARDGELRVLFDTDVSAIRPDAVDLAIRRDGAVERERIANDDVFVMTGGVPPFAMLERAGVSFDPKLLDVPPPRGEQGTGFARALAAAFALSLVALLWAIWHGDYYLLPAGARPEQPKHDVLRPSQGIGLALGVAAVLLIPANLAYLLRRSARFRLSWGSLQLWMTAHVATGILAFLCALLHGAMAPRDTPGGHALLALAALMFTGAVGRYFYAYVPRAANGRELDLEEVRVRLERLSERAGSEGRFGKHVRDEVLALIERRQWRSSFAGRVLALCGGQRDLYRVLGRLRAQGTREGVPDEVVAEALGSAKRAHRTALMAAHYEDLRALLGTWRYLHRWVALLMVLLVGLHVVLALVYGELG